MKIHNPSFSNSESPQCGSAATLLAALFLFLLTGPVVAESLEIPIARGADDAEQRADGDMYLDSSDLELTADGGYQTIGLRFTNVAIPSGAQIDNAYVQFTVDETKVVSARLNLVGEANDNAPVFAGSPNNISTRSKTAAGVSWAPPIWQPIGSAGADQQTPDLSSIVQEIVDRPGWRSGQALALIITGTGRRTAVSYEKDPSAAPVLHIEFTTGEPVDRPVAIMSASPESGLFPLAVNFDGSASTDNGSIVSYAWDFGDGSPSVTTTGQADHTYTRAGNFTARLTVTNDSGLSSSTSRTIRVSEPDDPDPGPGGTLSIAIARGSDDAEQRGSGEMYLDSSDLELTVDRLPQTVGLRFTGVGVPAGSQIERAYIQFTVDETKVVTSRLTLTGQASDNAPAFGNSVNNISTRSTTGASVSWSPPVWTPIGAAGDNQRTPDLSAILQEVVNRPGWGSGQALAIIITGTGKRTAVSYEKDPAAAPVLHIEYSTSGTDNVAPSAQMSVDPVSGVFPLAVAFDGRASTDDGNIENFAWDFGDGTTEDNSSGQASHIYTTAGTFTATLTVTDDGGKTDSTSQTITVTTPDDPDAAPTAVLIANPTNGTFPLTVAFDARDSTDDDRIEDFSWNFGDGTPESQGGAQIEHTYTEAGTFTATLTVTDSGGNIDSATQTITVDPPDDPDQSPVAALTATPSSGTLPLEVSFDGRDSSDDGTIVSYEWDFGNGSTDSTTVGQTSNVYTSAGIFTATLTVTDNGGNTDTATAQIQVDGDSPPTTADVVINELLASNETGITDELGERPDWLELFNSGGNDVDLAGWCLSDDPDEPDMWCFPASDKSVIAAGGYLLVFASGDSRLETDILHASFKLGKSGEFVGLFPVGSAEPVSSFDPFPALADDQSYGLDSNGQAALFSMPTPGMMNISDPPTGAGVLQFAQDNITSFGGNRRILLTAEDNLQTAYSLVVSNDASGWLTVSTAAGEDGTTADEVQLSFNSSGLIPGSYNGTVTAKADGFEDASVAVNLVVPHNSQSLSDWEVADLRLSGFSLGVDTAMQRLFYSVGPGYAQSRDLMLRPSYDEGAGFGVGFNGGSVVASGSEVTLSGITYESSISVELYKNGSEVASYDLVLSNLPVVIMHANRIVNEPDSPGIFQFVSSLENVSTPFYNMGVEYRGSTAQRYPKKPYAVEFTEGPDLDSTDGLDVQFPGLRDDDDWILDAAYRDHSFVRNLVSMDIWNDMRDFAYRDENGEGQGQATIKGWLVEVILDNQYQGVHVLEEKVDRKLYGLEKGSDSALYKADTNQATMEFPGEVRRDFEQKYPDLDDLDNYQPLEDLLTFINTSSDSDFVAGIDDLVNIDSIVDFW